MKSSTSLSFLLKKNFGFSAAVSNSSTCSQFPVAIRVSEILPLLFPSNSGALLRQMASYQMEMLVTCKLSHLS